MDCPNCSEKDQSQFFKCRACDERVFKNQSVASLWEKYRQENVAGAFLELVYRAYHSEGSGEKEWTWQKIYPVIRGHLKMYLESSHCQRWLWLLHKHGWSDDDVIQEVFKRKLIPQENLEFQTLKKFAAFVNMCILCVVIEIFKTLIPKPKEIEEFCGIVIAGNVYTDCLDELIEIICDFEKYQASLTYRGVSDEGKKQKLFRREEYYTFLKASIYEKKSPKQIIKELDLHNFKNKYLLPKEKIEKRVYELKREAIIELFLILLSHQPKEDICGNFKRYALSHLMPDKINLDDLGEKL